MTITKGASVTVGELARYEGVECSYTDGRDAMPLRTSDVAASDGLSWFTQDYDDEWCLRMLTCKSSEPLVFGHEITEKANTAKTRDYARLCKLDNGGSSATTNYPITCIAQTPRDGHPFCSFAFTTTPWGRGIVSGIYQYDDAAYAPQIVLDGAKLYSGWRSDGWAILVMPVAFLVAHVANKAKAIEALSRRITDLEEVITQSRHANDSSLDFGHLIRTLHLCSIDVIKLERRASFEIGLGQNIEEMLATMNTPRRSSSTDLIEAPLALARNLMKGQMYDLSVLPKRIDSQRSLIFNLTIQRDSRLNIQIGRTNLEIADTSRRIAEASMRDSASMKTIAIMTMLFLPGTAVASFFSMAMFNWQAGPGQDLASPYIYVYFVAAIPLTAFVIVVWYFTLRKNQQTRASRIDSFEAKHG